MLSAFTNCLKIPELRRRIFFTLGMLLIARVGANIPLPGLDPTPIRDFFDQQTEAAGGLIGLANMFTGGALLNGAIFALGIMPYISASIIMQLMGAVVPSIARLQQEGDTGRQKIQQYTRYLTIGIGFVQSMLLIVALVNNPSSLIGADFSAQQYGQIVVVPGWVFLITSTIFLTTGVVVLMWLGEQITQNGIGNGISLLITVGILADLPNALSTAWAMFNRPAGSPEPSLGIEHAVLGIALLIIVTAGIVMITQGQRRIPVQYAQRMVGQRVMRGQNSFLPLKVNYSGVMPVIFASAILIFPAQMLSMLAGAAPGLGFLGGFASFFAHGQPAYYITFSLLIFIFSYFWVSIMFKPVQIADDLKKNGGYVPGVRPGEPTARFLDYVMTRLTFFGSIALTAIALFPDLLLYSLNVPFNVAIFFGGTGMLITVSVLLDTLRQVETYLLQRHYDGFLKKGRIRGRSSSRARQLTESVSGLQDFWKVWRPLIVLGGLFFLFGLIVPIIEMFIG